MVIDIHAHYAKSESPWFPGRLVDEMARIGIDRICLFSAGDVFGHVPNEGVLAAAQEHPQIIPFALVELGVHSPADVDAFASQGFRGYKITNPRRAYDDESFFPLYERMERSGLPLLAHTGILMRIPQTTATRVNSNWMRPICLDTVLRAFPALNIIGAHLGAPWHEEASMMARMHPNYYVDLTGAWWGGWRVNKTPDFFRFHFFWEGAWDKVLFGTDILKLEELAPAKKYHDEMLAPLNLPEAARQKIYGGTAARLLRL